MLIGALYPLLCPNRGPLQAKAPAGGGFAADGVMCSYNGENGAPSCSNGWLLNDVLRQRWQRPDAVVVTDSGAVLNLQGPPVNATSVAAAAAMALNNGSDVNDGHGFPALLDVRHFPAQFPPF